jgi:hypothetical protein
MDLNIPIIEQARCLAHGDDPEVSERMAKRFEDLNQPEKEAAEAYRVLDLFLIAVMCAGLLHLLPLVKTGVFALFDLIARVLS